MLNFSFFDRRIAAVAAALALGACADTDPVAPRNRPEQHSGANAAFAAGHSAVITLDDHFAEIAKQLPAFAGMFQRRDSLVVALTDVGTSALIARSVIPSYTAGNRIDGIPAAQRLPMSYVQVTNSFATLRYWYEQLNVRSLPPEIISVDINEQTNRLTLGAASPSDSDRILGTVRGWAFPEQVVATEIVSRVVPVQALGDYIRPLVGGIKLQTNHLGTGKTGTLGFTAYKLVSGAIDSSTKYLISISHLTATQFGYDGVAFFQPDASYSQFADTIGSEVLDPALFTGSPCPSGKMCRYSEAALVQVRAGVSWFHGAVAGSTATTPPTPAPYTTTYLHHMNNSGQTTGVTYKTGLITGTTGGSVSASCIDHGWQGVPNSWLKCQWRINAPAKGGDSGAPVYGVDYWGGWYALYPFGVLTATNLAETQFYYSPLSGAYQDFGMTFETRTTCSFWWGNPPYCSW